MGCVSVTQSNGMSRRRAALFLRLLIFAIGAHAQTAEQDYGIFTEHPRLFLNAKRLRFLKRERVRESIRWQQFDALIATGARMSEPGFAHALHSRTTGDQEHCRTAIEWTKGPVSDLRQIALVFDWCAVGLDQTTANQLTAKLRAGIQRTSGKPGVVAARDRLLAAIALAQHDTALSRRTIRDVIDRWWRQDEAPALDSGKRVLQRDEAYALTEILHAVFDNLKVDLRENAPEFFRNLPVERLLGYYPASYPAAENEYRISAWKGNARPGPDAAALSRAADLALVAYDTNDRSSQFLQGWLTRDRFLLRGAYGAPYEFLWGNPYQPGLSYYHMPLAFHDVRSGRLFLRSSWGDDAVWFGCFDGEIQIFEKGERKVLKPGVPTKPLHIGDALVLISPETSRLELDGLGIKTIYVVGLRAGESYEIDLNGQKKRTEAAGSGGILALGIDPRPKLALRLRPAS